MTPILRVGLILLVVLIVGTAVLWWPAHADPKSPEMHERLRAVGELVGRGDSESLKTLAELVGDAEPRVAKAAIRAIGSRADEASRLKLEQILARNKSGMLRGTAAAELGNFEKADYRLLTDILLKDEAPKARAGAGTGLKRLNDPAALNSLVKALNDPDPDTRRNAYEAVGGVTAIYFEFDPLASPETRVEQVIEIKNKLAHFKDLHPH